MSQPDDLSPDSRVLTSDLWKPEPQEIAGLLAENVKA
jgi:hypothetical protein